MRKLVVLVSTVFLCFMVPITVLADNGGQADVSGKIIFYEDSSSEKPKESSSSSEVVKESSAVSEKPVGRFPNTGEIIKKSSVWIGMGLILLLIIFLIGRKRREHDEKEG